MALEREVEGDLFLQDIGQGFGFRPGSFDGAISISVLQWLLNAETSHATSSPPHRLTRFFTTLHSALKNPSRAVFQFYPSSDDQITLISTIAQRAGFTGGLVIDYPNSNKAKKVFLCLMVGGGGHVPKGLDDEGDAAEESTTARFERRRERERARSRGGKRKSIKDRDWILKKKEVCSVVPGFHTISYPLSSTENAGKRAFPTIPSSLGGDEKQYSSLSKPSLPRRGIEVLLVFPLCVIHTAVHFRTHVAVRPALIQH